MTAARDVVAPLAAARERSRAQVAQYHQIRAVLEKLRVSATSTDRSVTVELAAGGNIRIGQRFRRLRHNGTIRAFNRPTTSCTLAGMTIR